MKYIKSKAHYPDSHLYRTNNGLFPLHYACLLGAKGIRRKRHSNVDIVQELITAGFDINQQDVYGRTPLHWTALVCDLDLLLLLINHGADCRIRSLVRVEKNLFMCRQGEPLLPCRSLS